MNDKTVLVTGGAGFIGSTLVKSLILEDYNVINIDKLTYAGNISSLKGIFDHVNHTFEKWDICRLPGLEYLINKYEPRYVIHLAAESHVDKSIDSSEPFIKTNIMGTFNMLEACRKYYNKLSTNKKALFRFIHVSTDEVYGQLGSSGQFTEETPYDPSSPYSASKASSDHLVTAWYKTYGLPTIITNCSNNYGPYQYPEKLIPNTIIKLINKQHVPVYGNGKNIRDWLHCSDHCSALQMVMLNGRVGEKYNIGGNEEKENIEVVNVVCDIMDSLNGMGHRDLIQFVDDRPGHDLRYSIDNTKITTELGWKAHINFCAGIRHTVMWYMENNWWWEEILNKQYIGKREGVL